MGDSALLYPLPVWEEIESRLAAMPSTDRTKMRYLERVNYFGQQVRLDVQGRILVPQILRESAEHERRRGGERRSSTTWWSGTMSGSCRGSRSSRSRTRTSMLSAPRGSERVTEGGRSRASLRRRSSSICRSSSPRPSTTSRPGAAGSSSTARWGWAATPRPCCGLAGGRGSSASTATPRRSRGPASGSPSSVRPRAPGAGELPPDPECVGRPGNPGRDRGLPGRPRRLFAAARDTPGGASASASTGRSTCGWV